MATPGNSPTTDAAVLLAIVDKINDSESINDHAVYVVADSFFQGVSYIGDHYIQVVPGAVVDTIAVGDDGAGGGIGLIETEFRVVIYRRQLSDLADQDTQRITHDSLGLLQLVNAVDAQLINSMLGGIVLTPIRPVRRAPVSKGPVVADGWAAQERLYTVKFQVSYPGIQDQT